MLEEQPSIILRDAWCKIRLNLIREAVKETILELKEAAREDDRSTSGGDADENAERHKASQMALHTLTTELHHEAGLADESPSDLSPVTSAPMGVDPLYAEFLARYRVAAVTSLHRTLDRASALEAPSRKP